MKEIEIKETKEENDQIKEEGMKRRKEIKE